MNFNIFREYDIRGVADRDLPDVAVEKIGRAIGTFYRRNGMKRIAVGRDCRLSSDRIHTALIAALHSCGIKVVDVGIGPTPLLYFSVFHLDLDGGVQITGSHNPPADNGIKMMKGKASLFGPDIVELRRLIEKNDFIKDETGSSEFVDVTGDYVAFMQQNIRLGAHRPKVAIDAGNGAGGPLAVAAFQGLKLEPVALLCTMDGRFPVHHPDPTEPHNLELLRTTMSEQKLDLGIAFDGDADRIGVVAKGGRIVWGDQLLILFARDILKKNPGATIIGEVKCSQSLFDDIAAHGGQPLLWKTGHSVLKSKMRETHALLAGEMSGHVFFADRFFGFDDAIYAALRVVEILSHNPSALDDMLADLPDTVSTPEIRVPCDDDVKFRIVDNVKKLFQAKRSVIDVDGARIAFGNGTWGLVRASNTQPVIVLRFEAKTQVELDAARAEVLEALAQSGLNLVAAGLSR